MGYPEDEARGALRLSLGRTTSDEDVALATTLVPAVIARQREGAAALAVEAGEVVEAGEAARGQEVGA